MQNGCKEEHTYSKIGVNWCEGKLVYCVSRGITAAREAKVFHHSTNHSMADQVLRHGANRAGAKVVLWRMDIPPGRSATEIVRTRARAWTHGGTTFSPVSCVDTYNRGSNQPPAAPRSPGICPPRTLIRSLPVYTDTTAQIAGAFTREALLMYS